VDLTRALAVQVTERLDQVAAERTHGTAEPCAGEPGRRP
jgi:hypothetical protein